MHSINSGMGNTEMIELHSVYRHPGRDQILYELLKERTPEQSISHKQMPEWDDHVKFIDSYPYREWYFIVNEDSQIVGSLYLTRQNEIGISIFMEFQRKGYAEEAIKFVSQMYCGPLLANVNPLNKPSRELFEKLGGKVIQVTYEL